MIESNNHAIRDMLDEYLAAFEELSVEKALPHYHTPMTLHLPGQFTTLSTKDDVRGFLHAQFEQMKSQGYGSSKWAEIHIHALHDDAAFVSTLVQRFDVDGNVIVASGSSYQLARIDGEWRVISLIAHDPSKIIQSSPL